jgi:glucose/arabinose dehydrogenase
MLIYRGKEFADWRGDAVIAGLSSRAIVRVELGADGSAREVERYDMGARIRSVEEAADGSIWVLEDEYGDSKGRLLRLTK